MEKNIMNAKLMYLGNSIEIINFEHHMEDDFGGNPYNCCFDIKIISGNFSGVADKCEYDYKKWQEFINQLNELILNKTNRVEMHEIGYGNKIVFEGDSFGHINVSGIVYGDEMSHSLTFEFLTDQTVYSSFIDQLQ